MAFGRDGEVKQLARADIFQGYCDATPVPEDDMAAYRMCEPIMYKAQQNKDGELYERVVVRLKKQAGDNPMFARAWPQWEKQIATLKAAAGGDEDGGMGGR